MDLEKLFNVKDYTEDELIIALPNTPVTELYQTMQRERIRHIPIVNNGEAVGIVSDRDVKFVSYSSEVTEMTADQIMTENPYTVNLSSGLKDIISTMQNKKINSTLIKDDNGKIVGIFTSSDALDLLAKQIL